MSEQLGKWLDQVSDFVRSMGARGGALLVLPEYRPDLAKAVAHRLELDFYDFRAEDMVPKGTQAAAIDLDALNSVLLQRSVDGGALVFNVESLLTTKTSEQRRAWIEGFVRTDWPGLLLVPMTLFAQEAAMATDRALHLQAEDLPAQGIVSRMMN